MIIDPLLAPFERSLEQQANIDLLHDGAPSLLLMIDGLLVEDPDNQKLLISGTKAYSSYAILLAQYDEMDKARRCAERGRELAFKLLNSLPSLKGFEDIPTENLNKHLAKINKKDVTPLFWGGYGWAAWVHTQEGSPAGLAALPRIEPIMARVLELDESINYASVHIFFGTLYGAKPPMFGGDPEASQAHFEKALTITNRTYLPIQVTYAETYARQVFDRELFKSLLDEVLATPLDANPNLKASNSMAKMMARKLLDHIEDYF